MNTNLVGLLLPLAQRLVDGEGTKERLDPRFSSLRKSSRWYYSTNEGSPREAREVWELDVTLGAIVRSVVACGFEINYLASPDSLSNPPRMWTCSMVGSGGGFMVRAENPEEAVAKAMVELLSLTERWGVTV